MTRRLALPAIGVVHEKIDICRAHPAMLCDSGTSANVVNEDLTRRAIERRAVEAGESGYASGQSPT